MTTSSFGRRLLVGALLSCAVAAAQPAFAVGLHVSGTRVVESNGNNFIMRGVNHEHAWFATRTGAFADIKSFKANVVRVVLTGGRWGLNTPSDVANVVSLCKANRLICILEDHDTTGYGEDQAAYTLDEAVDYFATLKSVLEGQEDYIIINPGNEPIGNNNPAQWVSATTSAITRLRALGFQHLIMIDAPNWGQDWQYVMRDSAQTIWASDPNQNLVFSIHMYGVFNTATSISSYLQTFQNAGLPLVIGEFGYRNNNASYVDSDTVMAEAQARGLGYLAWSWCGNNDPYLDMTINFDKNNLSPWGQSALNGPNGIVATAKEATIFGTGTTYGLTVAKAGTGAGTVAGNGLDCGSTCSATYASGAVVTLTATAASGSTFTGWSGACAGTGICSVTMTSARSVTATFTAVSTSYTLAVAKAGAGTGTITGPSINCGSTCTAAFASGTSVTLTATAASGSTFAGWSGCASTSGTACTVSMTLNQTVTATFNTGATTYALSVAKSGTGAGTVTSSTGGISCGAACSATYTSGTTVTLTATAASGSTFGGWGGACVGTSSTCVLSMTTVRTVTATFNVVSTGTTPCANPVTFTGNTNNFNTTGAVCYRTTQNIQGWGCYNMDGRTLLVNNVAIACGKMPLPAKWSDGYYYFSASAGTYPWAGIYAW